MKRLKANKHMLHVLKNSNSKLRKTILKFSDSELIKTLCEICLNTLKGNANISEKYINRIKGYKQHIRKLALPKISLKTKRKLLVQKGGFLPILLSAILSGVIGQLI